MLMFMRAYQAPWRQLGRSLSFYTAKIENIALTAKIDRKIETICQFHRDTNNVFADVLGEKLNMLWTYNSLAIEGNSLTFGDTIFYLQHGLTVAGIPVREFLETDGHAEAISLLQDYIGGTRPFTKHFACEVNQLLTGHVKTVPAVDPHGNRVHIQYTAGRYRTGPTHVLTKSGDVHRYVEAFLIDGEMDALIDYVNSEKSGMHAVVKAAVAHYNFVRIHPFQDGNGRGARILMNFMLIKAGLLPAVVQVEDRTSYINALRAADSGDIQPFVNFIASSMDKTLDIMLETIEKLKVV